MGVPARQVGSPCWNSVYGGMDFRGLAKDNTNVSLCWKGGVGSNKGVGGIFLNNHNWVEYWDNENEKWNFLNVPPSSSSPDQGPCDTYNETHGCNWSNETGCSQVTGGPGAASRDHDIFAVTWSHVQGEGGDIIDVNNLKLSSGESVSPLVWSPLLTSPTGTPMKNVGLRVVNRTDFYRCRE